MAGRFEVARASATDDRLGVGQRERHRQPNENCLAADAEISG
jgi:hypothetical protein